MLYLYLMYCVCIGVCRVVFLKPLLTEYANDLLSNSDSYMNDRYPDICTNDTSFVNNCQQLKKFVSNHMSNHDFHDDRNALRHIFDRWFVIPD